MPDLLSSSIIGFFVFVLLLALYVFIRAKSRKKLSYLQLNYINSHWIRIIDMFPNNPKSSIMDSDKLLDYALNCHGFVGPLGEKLKKSGPRFSSLNNVWFAHKLRNKIAHELSDIDISEAKIALGYFKKALNDLGAKL